MFRRMGFTSMAETEHFELDRNRREMHRIACEEREKEEKKALDAREESLHAFVSLLHKVTVVVSSFSVILVVGITITVMSFILRACVHDDGVIRFDGIYLV